MRSRVLCVALLVFAGACREDKPPPPEPSAPPTAEAPTISPAAAAAKPLPPGRSPVPSLAEYASAREVTVKGSSALHCETKMIREWLRVSCRGKSDSGGTPTGVIVTRGGHGESITYAAGGVTNLITPVLEGSDLEARFAWTDKSYELVVKWPRGTPKPVVVGEFQGAASPLDGTAPSAILCECHKRLAHATDCSEAPFSQHDCERTYATDCANMLACARGEPTAAPRCLSGRRNAGVFNWCQPVCGAGHPPCAAGTECISDYGEPPVCM